MDKKSKNTLIVSVIALALVLIGVTYAYFSARITGLESASTISLTAGRMSIHYTEGDENVIMNNIYPREEAWVTKTFTLTAWNTTNMPIQYNVGLNIIESGFTSGYLTYDLRLVSSTNGTPIASTTDNPISGTGKIKFGAGTFTNADGDTHSYELKIYFKDNGLNQNDAQEAVFNARIYVEEAKNEPDGWSNPLSGSLLAGIKSNNSTLSTIGTIPGAEPSAGGLITRTVNDFCGGQNNCTVYYYNTREDAYFGNNGLSYNYNVVYPQLEGKWLSGTYYITEATSSQISYSNSERVLTEERNLLLSAEDDYGTSYYYRGAVDNNFVKFANMCWRIVRVDGLGNTKITLYNYNPTNASNPCDSSLDGKKKAFARLNANDADSYQSTFNTTYNKNTYIGFMYSNNPDSSDFATAHANDNDSTILTNLKTWYDAVFTTVQKSQLADVIWCNDKRIVSDTTYNPWGYASPLGTGLGADKTLYQTTNRLYPYNTTTSSYGTTGASPSLKCGDSKTDNLISKFTASTSTDQGYGNGALNGYKIGLLTSDEIAFAGANTGEGNSKYYLYKNANDGDYWYWTLSPSDFSGGAEAWYAKHDGSLDIGASFYTNAIRPAVSLAPNTTISGGNGTQSNPFVVAELAP